MSMIYDKNLTDSVKRRMRANGGEMEFWKCFAVRNGELSSPFTASWGISDLKSGWLVSDRVAMGVGADELDGLENTLRDPVGPNPYTDRLIVRRGYHAMFSRRGAMRVAKACVGYDPTKYVNLEFAVLMPVLGQMNDFVGAGRWSNDKAASVVFYKLHVSRQRALRAIGVIGLTQEYDRLSGDRDGKFFTHSPSSPTEVHRLTVHHPSIAKAIDRFLGEEWIAKPDPIPMRQDYLRPFEVGQSKFIEVGQSKFIKLPEPTDLITIEASHD